VPFCFFWGGAFGLVFGLFWPVFGLFWPVFGLFWPGLGLKGAEKGKLGEISPF